MSGTYLIIATEFPNKQLERGQTPGPTDLEGGVHTDGEVVWWECMAGLLTSSWLTRKQGVLGMQAV